MQINRRVRVRPHHNTTKRDRYRGIPPEQLRWMTKPLSSYYTKPFTSNKIVLGKRFLVNYKPKSIGNFEIVVGRTRHESPIGLVLRISKSKLFTPELAHVALSFSCTQAGKKIVWVVALQGKKGRKKYLNEFKNVVGKPWASYLLRTVADHGRMCNYKIARFIRPEYLEWYREATPKQQKMMRKLYYSVASNAGFKKVKGKPYFEMQL